MTLRARSERGSLTLTRNLAGRTRPAEPQAEGGSLYIDQIRRRDTGESLHSSGKCSVFLTVFRPGHERSAPDRREDQLKKTNDQQEYRAKIWKKHIYNITPLRGEPSGGGVIPMRLAGAGERGQVS